MKIQSIMSLAKFAFALYLQSPVVVRLSPALLVVFDIPVTGVSNGYVEVQV